ncbi:DegT/DnrJ/EryC1/StrS aminotransferase family protein [Candidatus Woesearchaeota archaeon]|nr:DegT/DnrJ/EryC1/StrS aminotransferase family protein [Candidatus Woesearchaeota archaeon]
MKEDCEETLRKITEKKYVLFVKRGNAAIRLALKLAKSLGCKTVLLQDMGGWITYKQFCEREKLDYHDLKTDYGILDPKALNDYSGCALLINSLPGYAALQKMREIARIGNKQGIFIINDISGSIGTEEAKYGDVVLASFAIDKPVNTSGHGGLIATNDEKYFDFLEKNNAEAVDIDIDFTVLFEKLKSLDNRIADLNSIRNKLIKELEAIEFVQKIVHSEKKDYGKGMNVIVRFDSDAEKEKLINLAEKEKLEFTLCPRDIRVNVKAVSFEIKRK